MEAAPQQRPKLAGDGTDDRSRLTEEDSKECLRVLATISAPWRKCPLFFMAKGITPHVEQAQLGDVGKRWEVQSCQAG
jgi:hypothetical protein